MAAADALTFDVSEADFEAAVLERSLDTPVLLDCWAPWCGPCRALGPVLDKLVAEYAGRFVLAKLNTDEAPRISAALRMRSIPLVLLFIGGQPVDQFLGALPEGQIRAFLDKHLPPGGAEDGGAAVSPVDELRAAAAEAPDDAVAEDMLYEALAIEPGHPDATLDLAERLLARGAIDDARTLLDSLPAAATDAHFARHAGLVKRLALAANKPPGDAAALAGRVAADPKDFEARFALAALHAWRGDFDAAFEQLLETVLRDKNTAAEGWRERARKQLVEWFDACPDPAVVNRGRRYLGMYLN